MTMKKFYCFGKNGFCDRLSVSTRDGNEIYDCGECRFVNGQGGKYREYPNGGNSPTFQFEPSVTNIHLKAEWKEYTGEDAGLHYCSECGQQAFNYDNDGEVVEVLSNFCPYCGLPMTPEALEMREMRLRGEPQ